ncbi:MAG TPA: septal ring lytic transglycosylase RlpA family protein [Propionibacteriaceae bacterium]|nr:septal ring lytic transglycosylase RlpA family protein [Propionibacteriaceae bacterium]
MRSYVPIAAGAVTLALGVGGFIGAPYALASDATLSVDGQATTVRVFNDTVGTVLKENGISVGEHDVVAPALDTAVTKGSEITVRYGRQVTVVVDGVSQTRWVTATTVDEALALFGVPADGAQVSLSRGSSIGREGISVSVTTPADVTLTADGQTSPVAAFGTVADLLALRGIALSPTDVVTPAATTLLSDGLEVKVVRVTTKLVSKDVAIPFTSSNTNDATLAKGTTKVKTAGVDGVSTETWTQTLHDGQVVGEERTASVVAKEPVNQVNLVGTKVAPKPATTGGGTTPVASGGTGPTSGAASGNSCGASYYWQGQMTANGERFNTYAYTAAHKTLPFNTMVKVTNPSTGQSVVVRINDRGPYISGRCLDLSTAAMQAIGGISAGVLQVNWEVVG